MCGPVAAGRTAVIVPKGFVKSCNIWETIIQGNGRDRVFCIQKLRMGVLQADSGQVMAEGASQVLFDKFRKVLGGQKHLVCQ